MPVIGGIGRGNDPRLARERSLGDPHSSAGASAGGALVPVIPAAVNEGPRESPRRPATAFLAHLAAARQRAPQTRAGRRADPVEAAAAYGAMLVSPTMTGRVFRRSV